MEEHPIMLIIFLIGCLTIGYCLFYIFAFVLDYVVRCRKGKITYLNGYKDGCKDMAEFLKEQGNLTDEQMTLLHNHADNLHIKHD